MQAIEKGAVDLDMGLHVHYFDYGGAFPRRFAGLKVGAPEVGLWTHSLITPFSKILAAFLLQSLGVTRRFLEQCIRERVFSEGLQSEVLHVRDSTRVAEYLWDNDAVKGKKASNWTPSHHS